MTFRVVIAKRAKDDLRRYFLLAAEHAPNTAAKWLDRFEMALESIAIHPERFALATRESPRQGNDSPVVLWTTGRPFSGAVYHPR